MREDACADCISYACAYCISDGGADDLPHGCTDGLPYSQAHGISDSRAHSIPDLCSYGCAHGVSDSRAYGLPDSHAHGLSQHQPHRLPHRCSQQLPHSHAHQVPYLAAHCSSLRCWHALLLAEHDLRRSECDMHADCGRRLRVRVPCWLPADACSLHTCSIGSVAGAASSMRGDSISDERADGSTHGITHISTDCCAY